MRNTSLAKHALYAALLCSTLCLTSFVEAHTAAVEYIDTREAFASATRDALTIDFASAAPARGFGKYQPAQGLTLGGAIFRASGGARFGPGLIYVVSAHYGGANPLYNTGTLPLLAWSAPNQPGNASLDVTLPEGTTAVGADVWTQQPYAGSVEVIVTTNDGRAHTIVVSTRNRPAAAFVGFVSDANINTISFRPPKGQTGLLLDNFTYGRKAEGRVVRATASTSTPVGTENTAARATSRDRAGALATNPAGSTAQTNRPASASPATTQTTTAPADQVAVANTNPSPATSPSSSPAATGSSARSPSQVSSSASPRGSIAYVRGGTEIRLVEADGSNDRRLWTHPYAKEGSAIHHVAWRPDGQELAFSSSHMNVASLYHADLYAVRPDGTGLRKITNAPDHSELGRYPKGAVSVTLRNEQPIWRQAQASAGIFVVYVVGADEPQSVALAPGMSKTLLFKNVADFGDHAQPVVAMYGQYRWFIPGVDVKAGRTITAPTFGISGDGYELFGAFRPVWRGDGARLSFRNGLCLVNSVPAQPKPGEIVFQSLFGGKHPSGACTWDMGPTHALADQVIYTANEGAEGSIIFRVKEGGAHPGTKIHTFDKTDLQILADLRWLTDGSGFLYTFPNFAYEMANVFRYDFATKTAKPLTNFEGEYARAFDVSPDGAWVVFERAKSMREDKGVDLWIMRTDGRDTRLLVRNALSPSWR